MRTSDVKTVLAALALAAAVGAPAQAKPTVERWCAAGIKGAHAGTLKVQQAQGYVRLTFDLSAIPKGSGIHGAWLYHKANIGQPTDPIMIYRVTSAEGQTLKHDGKRLKLDPPWYNRWVATEAVRGWVKKPGSNLGFAVAPFSRFSQQKMALRVFYDGPAKNVPPQVQGVRVAHRDGQTFIVWKEHPAYRPAPEKRIWVENYPGGKLADGPGQGAHGLPYHPAIILKTLRDLQGLIVRTTPTDRRLEPMRRTREVPAVTYRIYRHTKRITASNVHKAEFITEVGPLSGYDQNVHTIHYEGEYHNQREEPKSIMPVYCIDKGKPLNHDEGLYVHTTKKAGKSYYAVTMALAGTENVWQFSPANSPAEPTGESPKPPKPVLQWIQKARYRAVDNYWYQYWAAPPHVNLPNKRLRVIVGLPQKGKGPRPLAVVGLNDDAFNTLAMMKQPNPAYVTLGIENQITWMPQLCYNEGRGTLRAMRECKADFYSERFVADMIKWARKNYEVDASKIRGGGLYFGLRHPELFKKILCLGYTTTYDYRWAPGSPASVVGPKGVKTTDGDDAWAMFSVAGFVLKDPGRDIPFFIFSSGTGKDGGHTSEFGWQDDPRGWGVLQKARQPFIATWSCGGNPGPAGRQLGKVNWDLSIPAFSNCSLDNNPGNGEAADGDYYGQINGWLLWGSDDLVDEKDRWEMTVWVLPSCPQDACTVDVTPRHCKNFKPKPGRKFRWTNTPAAQKTAIQSGTVSADQWGLVTLQGVRVGKGKNRLVIRAQ